MASAGLKRQKGWDHNPWIHLIFSTWHNLTKQKSCLKHYFLQNNTDTGANLDNTIQNKPFTTYMSQLNYNKRSLHLYKCARHYITHILAPRDWNTRRHNRRLQYKRAIKGKFRFWLRYTYKKLQHDLSIKAIQLQRQYKISSRTRQMETTDRKNLNENITIRENKRRVDSQTKYEGLHRWPHIEIKSGDLYTRQSWKY